MVAETDTDRGGHSLSAIILAVASVEATVGEWFAIAKGRGELPGELAEYGELPRDRITDTMKDAILASTGHNTGEMVWFDRLRCLFELRNQLVHYHPQPRKRGQFPQPLDDCIRKKMISPGGDETMDWTSRLLLPGVAGQACDIAREARNRFLDLTTGELPEELY